MHLVPLDERFLLLQALPPYLTSWLKAIAKRFMIIPLTVPIVPAPSNFEFFLGKTIP